MCNREQVIREFMKSDEKFMIIDWISLGYISFGSARTSFNEILSRKEYGCYVMSRKKEVYLVKNGYSVPMGCFNGQSTKSINHTQLSFMSRSKIENFLASDLSIIEVPWMDLDYLNGSSCYESIKHTIIRCEYDSEIGIFRQKSRVFMFKYPKKEDFEKIMGDLSQGEI